MNYFVVEKRETTLHTGSIAAEHKWGLPGILRCPKCHATWSGGSKVYPSADLTPIATLADFEEPRAEPIDEYERLCELVRPLLPPATPLEPGAVFGPLTGKAQGQFGPFVFPLPWVLLTRRDALEKLQTEGLAGLKGCRTALRFRQRSPPELLELEILPIGRLHSACLPSNRKPPCPRCHRAGLTLPNELLLDESTLLGAPDLFRLEDFSTVIICTERFVDACQRLGLDGVVFHPVPTKRGS